MEYKTAFNEKLRHSILTDYNISKTTTEDDFNQLTFLAATICHAPTAFISIIDKNHVWLKSKTGIDIDEIQRKNAFAQLTLESEEKQFCINYSDDPKIFDEAQKHYHNQYKFYTGVPLKNPQGYVIGVLSVLDTKERELKKYQIEGLHALANQCMKLFEFAKQNKKFSIVQKKLKQKYQELEKFASVVSHDIKSPLANIISLTELLKVENQGKFDEETTQYLNYLNESSYSLRNYVDGILSFYRSEHILEKDYENVDLHNLLSGIAHLYDVANDVEIDYPETATLHHVNKAALTQVFLNLVSNALKYNSKDQRKIQITFKQTDTLYHFAVIDNGDGFSQENSSKIFELFTTLDTNDRDGNPGSGIGLATVKKLITSMGGTVKVNSTPGEGSNFQFTIKRV
ncbi:GAF domain-containing sensor histidine kinase [Gillisia marina]|uniref:GAF domain-containing sensor histidine kinase n=1 Tax=Gillisia marina TaxID=1167637 RepID=UPI00029B23D4|nr:GAF domain-containing sensor histidine kinase [Gillisia marina]